VIQRGDPIVCDRYYADDASDDSDVAVHAFNGRTDEGLGITRCGMRQVVRAGWAIYDPKNQYMQRWPWCLRCWTPERR
jgi:hypothetical protein